MEVRLVKVGEVYFGTVRVQNKNNKVRLQVRVSLLCVIDLDVTGNNETDSLELISGDSGTLVVAEGAEV